MALPKEAQSYASTTYEGSRPGNVERKAIASLERLMRSGWSSKNSNMVFFVSLELETLVALHISQFFKHAGTATYRVIWLLTVGPFGNRIDHLP
jgi:hypothetical protein